jgi:hypothetical protein
MTDKQIEKWFVELPEYESYVMAIGHYNKDLGYAGPNNRALCAKTGLNVGCV